MGNPDVTAILSSLLGAQPAPATAVYQPPPPPPQNTDLAALLQSLTGQSSIPIPQIPQPPQQIQPTIPPNIDLSALLSHLQPQQQPPQQPPQRWTSPPPQQQTRGRQRRDRDPTSRIKASRMDDIRESVRNSQADQNQYRALCQFYVLPCRLLLPNTTTPLECMANYRKRIRVSWGMHVLLCIRGIWGCMIKGIKFMKRRRGEKLLVWRMQGGGKRTWKIIAWFASLFSSTFTLGACILRASIIACIHQRL